VGKTVLMDALAPLLDLPVIPELGRRLCKELGYERIGDIPDQEGFKQAVLQLQTDEEKLRDSFISDRSTIDCWVLWQRWNICSAMTYDTEAYYERARSQSANYTHIIYVPPMFPAPEDGFRWTDPDYQKQIDRLVRSTLYDWGLLGRTHVVKAEGVKERVEEVMDWLRA
jgi:hypothetical protein